MTGSGRTDGYLPIGRYGVLADGCTVALLGLDGQVDWLPFPAIDSPPVAAALLDPRCGGYFRVAPANIVESSRRYVDRTNVIQSDVVTASGRCRITWSLNNGISGCLPWTELATRIEGLDGETSVMWHLQPCSARSDGPPRIVRRADTALALMGDQMLSVVTSHPDQCQVVDGALTGSVRVGPGDRATVALVGSQSAPLYLPDAGEVDGRIDDTIRHTQRLAPDNDLAQEWHGAVLRSSLALTALINQADGAIAAAATTSLPEWIGSNRNWDYRYAWVRDSSFAVEALINLGLTENVQRATAWLLRALRTNGPRLRVLYTLDGGDAPPVTELDLPGYRGSRPARAGNGAASQLQLGAFGDIFDTIWRYVQAGHAVDEAGAVALSALAEQCAEQWQEQDSGIWELGQQRHYTISKIGCWVAMDRAARLADAGQIPAPSAAARRWHATSDEIHGWIQSHCWSERIRSYTFYAGADDLDAAVLLAARTGFDRGARLATTVRAIQDQLCDGPCVYRYTGMREQEGAFIACSFWLVEALAALGDLQAARHLMGDAVSLANDLGLLSEQIDPTSRELLGNIPQALSHLALINAAHSIKLAERTAAGGA